jgi:hypothetical protein
MSDSPRSDAVQEDSTPTLTLPQLDAAEKEFETRGKATGGFNQDVELQSPVDKEKVPEDEEWLESPAHPRNWPPRRKWSNMAIVSNTCTTPRVQSLKA